MSVRAGILVTGTEVLSGFVTDRNGPWLSDRLGELGVEVSQITIVGDRAEDLEAALQKTTLDTTKEESDRSGAISPEKVTEDDDFFNRPLRPRERLIAFDDDFGSISDPPRSGTY